VQTAGERGSSVSFSAVTNGRNRPILLKNSVIEMGFGVGSFSSSVGERLFGGV